MKTSTANVFNDFVADYSTLFKNLAEVVETVQENLCRWFCSMKDLSIFVAGNSLDRTWTQLLWFQLVGR
jgi:hypothetical protein